MNLVNGLALGRIANGLTAVASAELAGRLFRLDVARNPQLPYMSRMFASREVALGAITLLAKGNARRKLVALGMAVDGADAFAGYHAMRTGSVTRSVGVFLTAPPLGAVFAAAAGLFAER